MFCRFIAAIILILCLVEAEARPVSKKLQSTILKEQYKELFLKGKSYENKIARRSALKPVKESSIIKPTAKPIFEPIVRTQQRKYFEKPVTTNTDSCSRSFPCDFRPLTVKPVEEKTLKKLTKGFSCPELACPGTDYLLGLYPFADLPGKSSSSDVTRIFNNAIYNKVCPGISNRNINLFGVCLHMCKTDAECNQLHAGWHCCPIRDLLQDQFILSCVPPIAHYASNNFI